MAKHELVTQVFYDGAWHTVKLYDREDIEIVRDRGEGQGEPTTGSVEFDLPGHDFNPENVASPLYGLIGPSMPVRMYELGLSFLETTGPGAVPTAFTPDHSSLDITSDIDIRVDCQLTAYNDVGLAAKFITPNQKSWALYLDSSRRPVLHWSSDGTAGTATRTATAAVPATDGDRIAIRATLDADNGAGQHVVTFLTAPTIAGPWTQLGSTVTTAGTASIFASTSWIDVGGTPLLGPLYSVGRFYEFELRSGIGGTVVTNPKFHNVLSDGPFTDAFGRQWSATPVSYFRPNSVRFYGEVSSFKPRRSLGPVEYGPDGVPVKGDRWVHVTANGPLLRIGQGDPPALSALWVENLRGGPVAMWPITDGADASQAASALPGGAPLSIQSLDFNTQAPITLDWEPVAYNAWVEPLATAAAETQLYMLGNIEMDPGATEWAADFVFAARNAGGAAFDGNVLFLHGTGTGGPGDPRTDWLFGFVDGNWGFERRIYEGASLSSIEISAGPVAYQDGRVHHGRVTTVRDGADVDWAVWIDGVVLDSGTLAASSWSTLTSQQTSSGTTGDAQTSIGFVTIWDTASPPANAANAAVVGRSGELAADRLARLCLENGLDFDLIGSASDTVPMGPQPITTFVGHVAEIERTDSSRIMETRYKPGLTMRTRASMSAQPEKLLLDMDAGVVLPPILPDVDNSNVVNDVTVVRTDGSSARAVREDGPRGVNTIGRYPVRVDVNTDVDNTLPNHAHWRVAAGTQTGTRYPQVGVDLDAAPHLAIDASSVDGGDIIGLDNAEPDRARLMALGYTELRRGHRWSITFNTGPGKVFNTGVWNDSGSRYDSAYSTTGGSVVVGTTTSISVVIAAGRYLWVTGSSAPQFPIEIEIAGARFNVTAISGASSPQTFTVDAAPTNGVPAKTIAAGASVRLAKPVRYGF
ncbi:hypothetical protein [Phytohabitans rumicis]|uniref:Uncharacterized protein n=1 Tax=Phytohabitans rumicis TaxID=1076125 RepID=A0A6V8LC05_9ACTN|nr:hypothetical protein [Phytohabitans rumicis]GFJ91587.1 hypothetical protein Prum_052290 [Phytohabitans rumicis]